METIETYIQTLKQERSFEFLSSVEILSITDTQGTIRYVNALFESISGFKADEVIGATHRLIDSGYHSVAFWKDMWDTVLAGQSWSGLIQNKAKSGRLYWLHANIIPLFSDNELIAFLSIQHDVSREKRTEQALEKDIAARLLTEDALQTTKLSLERTMRLARVGGWEVDFTTGQVVWMGITKELAEVEPDFEPELIHILDFYKEGESRQRMLEAVEQSKIDGKGFEIEVELVTGKGRTFWVRVIAEPKMVNGQCTKLYGYFQDISAQIALRASNQLAEKKFSSLIEKSADAIFLQEADGVIRYFSSSAERMLGYTAEEMVGKNAVVLFHPDDLIEALQRRTHIRNVGVGAFPLVANRIRHKDGHYIFVEGTITNLLHDDAVKAIVVNFRNVTDQKMTEHLLRQKNERLEQIAQLFSHEVRGPVATIKGLLNLFDPVNPAHPTNSLVIDKIKIPIGQLDDIISKIVKQNDELQNL